MKIRNNLKTLLVFDLPSGSVFLPGIGGSRPNVVDVPESALGSQQIQRALEKKWVRILKDKAPSGVSKPSRPVAPPVQPVAAQTRTTVRPTSSDR